MGAQLVTLVLANWTHVSDPAFRVLVRMAVSAFDNPHKGKPASIYNGGRELLAMSLKSKQGTDETRFRAVKRALRELSEEGAIEHVQTGWAGQNSTYRLTLSGSRKGGLTRPPVGGSTRPPSGGSKPAKKGGATDPPMEQEEQQDLGATGEQSLDLRTTSHPPHANHAEIQNVIRFPSVDQLRGRDAGRAELAAKAAQARDHFAAMEARRKAAKEAN